MLNELEQKIRKAIPELNELGVGCEFMFNENHKFRVFSKSNNGFVKYYDVDFNDDFFELSDKEIKERFKITGKPTQLNHVLEYVGIIFKQNNRALLMGSVGLRKEKHLKIYFTSDMEITQLLKIGYFV